MTLRLVRGALPGRASCLSASIAIGVSIFVIWMVLGLLSFLTIFDGRHTGIRITQPEVASAHHHNETLAVVPKIIHQIYHNWKNPGNEEIPSDWDETRKTCIDANPGWEYKLWTEKTSRRFLEDEYPAFLTTYDSYRYPVQKIDTLRYFLMRHYGGIYIDLDNGCKQSLEPLRYYPSWLTDGGRGALSNNILGARPQHPFWIWVTEALPHYNINWVLPYIIISYCSGQWFLTQIWDRYHAELPGAGSPHATQENRMHQVMMDMREGADPWIFFSQGRGGSWDNWDNHFFGWLGNLSQSIPVLLFVVILVVGSYCLAQRFLRRKRRRGRGYSRVSPGENISDV